MAIIFDFDSTLIQIESLELLFNAHLENNPDKNSIVDQIKHITDLGMAGKIGFHESITKRVQLLKASRDQVIDVGTKIKENFISRSVLNNINIFSQFSNQIYVISGGFEELTLPTTRYLGIPDDHVFTNQFIYNKNVISGLNLNNPLSQNQGKIKQLQLLNLPHPLIAIGDGFTDWELYLSNSVDSFILFTENVQRQNLFNKSPIKCNNFHEVMEHLFKLKII